MVKSSFKIAPQLDRSLGERLLRIYVFVVRFDRVISDYNLLAILEWVIIGVSCLLRTCTRDV